MSEAIESAPHELEGNLQYRTHGLDPYWMLVSLILGNDGGTTTEIAIDGETWEVSLSYQQGGIAPRPADTLDSRLWEVRINGYGRDQRKATYLVQPRFEEMRHYKTGDLLQTQVNWEGVNVRIDGGSNLEPDRYPELLHAFVQGLADHLDERASPRYLARLDGGNITAFERYVRVRRSMAQKLLRADGVFRRLFDLLAEQEGSEVVYAADNTKIVGYNHRLKFGPARARELGPGHSVGRQVKLYYPREVGHRSEDDPLYHPKLGVLANQSLNKQSIPWDEHEALSQQLEETIVNLLAWSDIPVDPDPTTFIADDHFEVCATDREPAFIDDPTPQVEAKQEYKLITQMRGLTDADFDVLERLATDGGEQHYANLADGAGCATSTLYRVLDHLDGLLENESGVVRFVSEKIRQDVASIISDVETRVETAADAVADVLDLDRETLRQQGGAFQRWLSHYGGEVLDGDVGDGLRLKVATTLSRFKSSSDPFVADVLHQARLAYKRMGRDPREITEAHVDLVDVDGEDIAGRLGQIEDRFDERYASW